MNGKFIQRLLFFCFLWTLLSSSISQVRVESVDEAKIFRVPHTIQTARIEEEYIRCYGEIVGNLNANTSNQSGRMSCPTTWDQIKCWPETLAGETVQAACPDFIDGFQFGRNASKTCLHTGEWFMKNGIPWTNYSSCRPSKNSDTVMHYGIIHTIGQVGYAVSIFALLIASVTFLCFRRLNCERNNMHVSLFVSFLLRAVMYNISLSHYIKKTAPSKNVVLCRVVKTAQNYAILSNNMAVFVEALYLHNVLFYHTFSTSRRRLCYYVTLSWALPAAVTLIWVVFRIEFDNLFCWDAHDDPYKRDFWLIQSFTIALTLGNLLLFVHLMKSIYSKMISQPLHEITFSRRIIRSMSVLIIVFGVYNLVFIPIDILTAVATSTFSVSSLELIKLYCEHIISSCQGLLVSILFCFNHHEVHTELKRSFFRKFNYFPTHLRADSIPLPSRSNNRRPTGHFSIAIEDRTI